MADSPKPKRRPYFVLTLPRSGSTLLRQLLDGHAAVCCPPETQLAATASGIMTTWLDMNDPASLADRRRRALREVRHMVRGFIEWNLAKDGKQVFCDKSLPNVDNVRVLAEAFPRARFICLFRHSMDMIASSIEACKYGYSAFGLPAYVGAQTENFVAGVARAWTERTQVIRLVQKTFPKRCFAVHYETLVTNPASVVEPLCEFLEVDVDPMIASVGLESLHRRGHGDFKVLDTWEVSSTSLGRGSTVPVHFVPPMGLTLMNEVLNDLGYPEVSKDWNFVPSPLRRGLATPSDYRALSHFFEEHVARTFQTVPLEVGSRGFRVRVVIEESGSPEDWILDAAERRVFLGDESVATDCTLISRGAALFSLAAGYQEMSDLHEAGDIRYGGPNSGANTEGLRLLGLAVAGFDRTRRERAGVFTRDILDAGG